MAVPVRRALARKTRQMDALGVNAAKRKIAKQAGADPYTTNPVLAKQLDDLARAAVAGGVSLDVALAVSTAGVATAISATATVGNLVWDKSPADIRTINEEKLAAMGIGAGTVRAFVTNRWFTPTLSVPFVDALAQMPDAANRAGVVALAGGVASESEARFVRNAVDMARRVGTERDPVIALEIAGRILVVHTRGGRIVVPAPVDYVVWTEPVRRFAERPELRGARRGIHVTGLASGSRPRGPSQSRLDAGRAQQALEIEALPASTSPRGQPGQATVHATRRKWAGPSWTGEGSFAPDSR